MAARHRIWIVDDVELELEAARRSLAPSYDIEVFTDGASVIESAVHRSELPDVLILDWHMSGVGGLDVLRFLRATDRTVGLPILVFTSTGDGSDLVQALSAGADDYVGKSSSTAELDARVATLIRAKGLRERAEKAERELAALLDREREARAEAEASNLAKDQFLATVSHELRTPLHAILGWAQILASGKTDPDTISRGTATIQRNAHAQARIIDDLLDVSRIVSGKLRLERLRVDVADAVEQAVESARPTAAARRVHLAVDVARDCIIAGDPARLQQIVWNLLSNAIKFTPPEGRVDLTLTREGDSVVVRVQDTGSGISPELMPHVFDRFRQGDSSSTRAQGGLGLGLAIVRHLVQLHGGQVTASSEGLGRGARFEVVLPALPSVTTTQPTPSSLATGDLLTGRCVLLVEDEPDAREVVRALLEAHGAQVIEADCAAAALALLDRQTPSVLVSDIAMPGMDGYQLLRAVRARRERWIPAIAVTAMARDEDRWATAAAGFQAHLAKPIDADELVRTVVRLCAVDDPPVLAGSEP